MMEPRTPMRSRPMSLAPLFSAAAISALALACAATPDPRPLDISAAPESLRAGLDLYAAREFERAGAHFHEAAHTAIAIGNRDLAHRVLIAECTAWVRARQLEELDACAENLIRSQRRTRTADPRVNTLIAMGAIAGGRPAPSLRVPSAVRVVLRAAAETE